MWFCYSLLLFPCLFLFILLSPVLSFFFFFNDTATTEIYTLSLHDALPIYIAFGLECSGMSRKEREDRARVWLGKVGDRKSTRLNSSHQIISYAVFCLKKKKTTKTHERRNTTPSPLLEFLS